MWWLLLYHYATKTDRFIQLRGSGVIRTSESFISFLLLPYDLVWFSRRVSG